MSYTPPDYNDIDFVMSSGYTAPDFNDINFEMGSDETALEDFSLDISVQGTILDDFSLDISAYYENFENTSLDIDVLSEDMENFPIDLSAGFESIDNDLSLNTILSAQDLFAISMDIYLSAGIVTTSIAMDINVNDGNQKQNASLDVMAVSTMPEFKSVYAMHLNSAIREI